MIPLTFGEFNYGQLPTMYKVTEDQKESLYHDGFVVLSNIVPEAAVSAAKSTIYRELGSPRNASVQESPISQDGTERIQQAALDTINTGTKEEIMSLVEPNSALQETIRTLLGPINPLSAGQVATSFPSPPDRQVNESGYPNNETPFFSWHGHLDGLWNGHTAIHQDLANPMSDKQWEQWFQDPARNGVSRRYPEFGTTIKNFTALLGIPLSDQTREGCGNLGLLRGAHHDIEAFFQHQQNLGGPLGPDGPDWERFDNSAPNKCGLRHYPESVREKFTEGAEYTSDGRSWPRPTLVKAKPGDAILVLHSVPHCATRVSTEEPRLMIYFRLTSANRPAGNETIYPEALCDIWLEWDGMRDTVQRIRE